ncbi:probable serine/threonine-protein kinase clkA [Metopolophium dirhodum]|uniref:probable serine/threonine-protein kinase clkA n=2 Tax=Metopolophium dirhodum TaxID=44670 RepID=UPI0029907254|nr:probable serine/threonine-protein kinase clkA [Metopolophium dirhodum]
MDVGTYIIIKGNDVLTQLDESDEECEELTEQFNVKPQVKDTVFNPNSKIEKLVLNKKKKLDNKYGNNTDNNNDNVSNGVNGNDNVGDNVNDNGNASSNVNDNGNACNYVNDNGNASNNVNDDYENSDIVSDSGSDSDPDIVNFIWNYENNLRTVPKSDRLTKSKSKNVTNFKSLTSNSVVENLQYHGADIYKNYMYYVDNDSDYMDDKITKLYKNNYSQAFANKFKEAIITTIYTKSKVIKSTFDIETKVVIQLVKLCHAYLSYALGPAMMRRGKPLTSAEWSKLFIRAIHTFEKEMAPRKYPTYEVYPLRVVDEEKKDRFDLLLVMDGENSHYVYISNFSRLIRAQKTRHNGSAVFCKRCFTSFDNRAHKFKLSGQEA